MARGIAHICRSIAPVLPVGAALRHRPWNSKPDLSRALLALDSFLSRSGHDRGPWLAVAFGSGIAAWFLLPSQVQWIALCSLCVCLSLSARFLLRPFGPYHYLAQAFLWVPLFVAAGCLCIWARSQIVGAVPIERPMFGQFSGQVLKSEAQPALQRTRLVVAMRDSSGRALKVRLNLPERIASADANVSRVVLPNEGDVIAFRARLMPPSSPPVPGAYDFARSAWFAGLAASGSVLGEVEVLAPAQSRVGWMKAAKGAIAAIIDARLGESAERGIAEALIVGDRGAIEEADADAMRDAGLAHLISISGLHVSAVIGFVFFTTVRMLALFPALALRWRLPLIGAATSALAGVGYTLLTGAEVPTVRSCCGALLILFAIAVGREPLSLRMLAVVALGIMAFWPETLAGPSFQLSFAAVTVLIALSGAAPVRKFLQPREEGLIGKVLRAGVMLFVTGLAVELALMPIGLFHFHRAGLYGVLANMLAIPLTTLVIMPATFAGLVFDLVGLGAPFWWIAQWSIGLLLEIARITASQPGAVIALPSMSVWVFGLFVAGGLWLCLWSGKARLAGFAPILLAACLTIASPPPDLLITGDGRQVAVLERSNGASRLRLLRDGRSTFLPEILQEVLGADHIVGEIALARTARCNTDFCVMDLGQGSARHSLLISRGRFAVPERALAAACERVDIVVSDRWLPRSCAPRWFRADRRMLERSGGLAVYLKNRRIESVAQTQGAHPWWRAPHGRGQ